MINDATAVRIDLLCARCEQRVPAGELVFARISNDDTADEEGQTAVCYACLRAAAQTELESAPYALREVAS